MSTQLIDTYVLAGQTSLLPWICKEEITAEFVSTKGEKKKIKLG